MDQLPNLTWEKDVCLITQPLMAANFVKVFAIVAVVIGGLFVFLAAVAGDMHNLAPILEMMGVILCGIMVLLVLIALVVFRNRMRVRFSLDSEKVSVEVIDRRARIVNKAAAVGGVLMGNPALVGMGLIGMSSESQSAAWSAIQHARYYSMWNSVSLSNGWRTVLILFCNGDNYDAVAGAVGAALASQASTAHHKNPLPMMLVRTVLVALACVPLFGLPNLERDAMLPACLALAMALTGVWLIPFAAWVLFACLGWLAYLEVVSLYQTHESLFGGTKRNLDVLSGDDQAMLAMACLGAAYLIWIGIGYLRGKIRSGLAGDLTEMAGTLPDSTKP